MCIRDRCNHPNIKGIKDSSGNIVQISEILRDVPEDFAVFAGSASFLMPALVMGAKGGTLASANVAPDLCVRIYELVNQGKYDEARTIQKSILKLNSLITARYGVAGLKACLLYTSLAAFFLAFVMHGLVAAASLHGGYYPRMLAGSYLGEAICISAWSAILEWGAIMVLGRSFASERRPAVPTWWVAGTLLFFAVAIAVSLIAL